VLLLALPAFVAIWSGWVGLGELTGFGPVHPLPGIADNVEINTAVTLPIGMEAYASYALSVWLSGRVRSDRTRRYAMWSAFGSLAVGAAGQVVYHLMTASGMESAPWPVTVLVACLPVAVLGMGAALAHMLMREHSELDISGSLNNGFVNTESGITDPVRTTELVRTTAVRTDIPAAAELPAVEPVKALGAHQEWPQLADALCSADPASRRDPVKVAEILRLRYDENWTHSKIADHVALSTSAVTRTLEAARQRRQQEAVS
jgi:hypothetical protein